MQTQRNRERTVGYTLLVMGLVLILVPALLAFVIFLTGTQIPQLVPYPAGENDPTVRSVVQFSNVCLIFFIFIIAIWAGSIVSSRGVAMIKDLKLKMVRKSLQEADETASKIRSKD